jgi:hypothetical protein
MAVGLPEDSHIMQQTANMQLLPLVLCLVLLTILSVLMVPVGEGRDIELRHQRNPDVVFDYVRAVQGGWHMRVTGSRACCKGNTAQPHALPVLLSSHRKGWQAGVASGPQHPAELRGCGVLAGREWDVPVEVFNSIETLLPTGRGRFLELWAPAQAGRAGWTHLAEAAASEAQ